MNYCMQSHFNLKMRHFCGVRGKRVHCQIGTAEVWQQSSLSDTSGGWGLTWKGHGLGMAHRYKPLSWETDTLNV